MLSRLIYGARIAMTVAIVASLGAMIIGAVLAHIAGYFGGWIDWLIGRAVDVWMSFPPVILSLILMVGLGTGLRNVILAIVLVDWTRFCRVLRAEVLVVTRRDYVAAARLVGFSHWRTITREILPATAAAADHAPQPRNGHRGDRRGDPLLRRHERRRDHAGLGPDDRRRAAIHLPTRRGTCCSRSLTIFVTVLGFNVLGDGLRRTLDVRLTETQRRMSLSSRRKISRSSRRARRRARAGASASCRSTLAPGKVLGLVGESGAGKSMVGRAIAQLLPPGFAVDRRQR